MRLSTLFLLLMAFRADLFATPAQVIIIPSGEIDSSGNLTQQGLERAGALASYITLTSNLTYYGLPSFIFGARPSLPAPNNTQAYIQTVGPIAQALNLPIHSGFSAAQSSNIASLLNSPYYDNANVLICWRPDAIQTLAAALGVSSPPSFPSGVFNQAWVIDFSSQPSLQVYLQNLLSSDSENMISGCGSVPYPSNTNYNTPAPIINSSQVWSFVSEPSLNPMKITVNINLGGLESGSIFLAPYAASSNALIGQPGALILHDSGDPIWFRPMSSPNLMTMDFRTQTLNGDPVLTFWQGTLASSPAYTNAPTGSAESGCFYILDNTYAIIHTISAQNGFTSDVHEFLLTPSNTALFLSTKTVAMDLTPYGGPQNGYVQDFAIQEVDVQTGELLFFWDALENIPLSDSYYPASNATSSGNIWDAYHLNSIGLTDNTDILVSGRNTWTIYRISSSGSIVWQLGGKHSDFTFGSGAEFSWQHDARFLSSTATTNVVSLFDDNCCVDFIPTPETPYARGLVLQLNVNPPTTATLMTSYFHDPLLQVGSQGNVQSLTNGNKFIGWGQESYYSEFAAAGNTQDDPSMSLLYDAEMPGNNICYRAYRNTWMGTPYYPPSIAVESTSGQITVYASWNGSTETTAWQVYAGAGPTDLSPVGSPVGKISFETAIEVANPGPYFQVRAMNGSQVIGVSNIVQL